MDMSGQYTIPAPRDRVWAALNDPAILQQCIPGCEEIERVTPTEWTAKVRAKVGPVSAAFKGKVTLSDLDPPNGYKISGEGTGGAAGFAKGGADVRLADEGSGTRLSYTVNAQVGGKLAQIGSRLIDGTARKMADEFFGRFAALMSEPAPADATAPAPESAAPVEPAPSPATSRPDAAATAALASEGNVPYVPANGSASGGTAAPATESRPAPEVGARRSLPPWAWVIGVAVIVAILLAIFAG